MKIFEKGSGISEKIKAFLEESMNTIEKKVREIIEQIIQNDEVNVWDLDLKDNLFHYGLDSMMAVSLIVLLEDEFSFEFPDEDLNTDNIKDIERIVSYVSKKCS